MPAVSPTPADIDQHVTTIRVQHVDQGGWDLHVEVDGKLTSTEHFTDWHRVERRRRLALEVPLGAVRVLLAVLLTIAMPVGRVLAQEAAPGLLSEPRILEKGITFITGLKGDEADRAKEGFYPELGHMITGAGWISLGPGYRQRLFEDRAVLDLSTAISWRAYKVAQARVELPSLAQGHLTLGSQMLWNDLTQVSYFGSGPDSVETARSDYRLQASDLVLYAIVRSSPSVSLTGRAGWLSRPGVSSSTGPFDRDLPDTVQHFPDDPAASLSRQPRFLHADIWVAADTRDHAGHPSRGVLYRAGWAGFSDRESGAFTFDRYEVEGAHFLPLAGGRSVVALHGWGVFSTTTDDRAIPFYLLPSLGGHNTLRGYVDYRFHDRHLVVVNAESRWALFAHLDGAVFIDAGNVAPRAADLDLTRTSFGTGLRLHTGTSTIARLDVANGDEGWRFLFRVNDPLRLGRLGRRTAAVPFVP